MGRDDRMARRGGVLAAVVPRCRLASPRPARTGSGRTRVPSGSRAPSCSRMPRIDGDTGPAVSHVSGDAVRRDAGWPARTRGRATWRSRLATLPFGIIEEVSGIENFLLREAYRELALHRNRARFPGLAIDNFTKTIVPRCPASLACMGAAGTCRDCGDREHRAPPHGVAEAPVRRGTGRRGT